MFRRNTGHKTVNGNTHVYIGLRGGLFTKNGTPVYKFANGVYSTNKNFNINSYMAAQISKGH